MVSAVSRRVLLSALGVGGAAGVTACSRLADNPRVTPSPTPATRRSVVVVGAGAAGLMAARTLAERGIEVEIVEARDRIGGRVFTTDVWGDLPIDIGASWIHGPKGNPLTPLAKAAGATMVSTSYDSYASYVAGELKRAGLTKLREGRWSKRFYAALEAADEGEQDISVAAALAAQPWYADLRGTERAELGYVVDGLVSAEWGASPDEVSAWTAEDGKYFKGDDVLFPQGFSRVLEKLAEGISVTLEAEVTAIDADKRGAVVRAGGREWVADAVIVTLPLGVLKAGAVDVATGLPEATQAAIDRIGFGVLSKTFLRFDKAFWATDVDWHGYVGAQPGQWAQWLSVAKAGAPVLLGFNSGDNGRRVEAASPEQVIAETTAVLRDMFGPAVAAPRGVLTSAWSTDPWALGSYSFNAVGATRADRVALAAPIAGRIFWAGEATEPDYHSTVHGAVLSGIRAADEVAAALKG